MSKSRFIYIRITTQLLKNFLQQFFTGRQVSKKIVLINLS
jgi:hypothetical protein